MRDHDMRGRFSNALRKSTRDDSTGGSSGESVDRKVRTALRSRIAVRKFTTKSQGMQQLGSTFMFPDGIPFEVRLPNGKKVSTAFRCAGECLQFHPIAVSQSAH